MALKVRYVQIPAHHYRRLTFVTSQVLNNLVTVRNVGDHPLSVRKLYSLNGRDYYRYGIAVYVINPGKYTIFRLPPRTFSGLLFGSRYGSRARVSWLTVPIG